MPVCMCGVTRVTGFDQKPTLLLEVDNLNSSTLVLVLVLYLIPTKLPLLNHRFTLLYSHKITRLLT